MARPTVSIVIPAYNEEDVIKACLESCLKQSDAPDEIIVVDNNSTDSTASIVRSFQRRHKEARIRLLKESKQGIIPARNKGFAAASSEVLGRIDADAMISREWVANVRRTFSDASVAAATGPVSYHDMPLPGIGLAVDARIRKVLHMSAKKHTFLFGSNMAIRKSAWLEIQDIIHTDEKDELHEDIDIALCLFRKGLRVVYDSAMIGSMSARRLEDSPKDFYNYVMRFERTFKAHDCRSAHARIPMFIYLLIYFPIRTLRKVYQRQQS